MKHEIIQLVEFDVWSLFFRNVNEDLWPEDPMSFLRDNMPDYTGDGIVSNAAREGIRKTDKAYRQMEVREPFVPFRNLHGMVVGEMSTRMYTTKRILEMALDK